MFKPRPGAKNITNSRNKGNWEVPSERALRLSQLSRNP
jgi:hypothetical protein